MLKNSDGLGLIQVMIAASVVGTLTVASLKLNKKLFKDMDNIREDKGVNELAAGLETVLKSMTSCSRTFSGLDVRGATGASVDRLLNEKGLIAYRANCAAGSEALCTYDLGIGSKTIINSIKMFEFEKRPDPELDRAKLRFTLSNSGHRKVLNYEMYVSTNGSDDSLYRCFLMKRSYEAALETNNIKHQCDTVKGTFDKNDFMCKSIQAVSNVVAPIVVPPNWEDNALTAIGNFGAKSSVAGDRSDSVLRGSLTVDGGTLLNTSSMAKLGVKITQEDSLGHFMTFGLDATTDRVYLDSYIVGGSDQGVSVGGAAPSPSNNTSIILGNSARLRLQNSYTDQLIFENLAPGAAIPTEVRPGSGDGDTDITVIGDLKWHAPYSRLANENGGSLTLNSGAISAGTPYLSLFSGASSGDAYALPGATKALGDAAFQLSNDSSLNFLGADLNLVDPSSSNQDIIATSALLIGQTNGANYQAITEGWVENQFNLRLGPLYSQNGNAVLDRIINDLSVDPLETMRKTWCAVFSTSTFLSGGGAIHCRLMTKSSYNFTCSDPAAQHLLGVGFSASSLICQDDPGLFRSRGRNCAGQMFMTGYDSTGSISCAN